MALVSCVMIGNCSVKSTLHISVCRVSETAFTVYQLEGHTGAKLWGVEAVQGTGAPWGWGPIQIPSSVNNSFIGKFNFFLFLKFLIFYYPTQRYWASGVTAPGPAQGHYNVWNISCIASPKRPRSKNATYKYKNETDKK